MHGKAMEKVDLERQIIAYCSCLRIFLDKDSEEGTSRQVPQLVAMALWLRKRISEVCVEIIALRSRFIFIFISCM